jgi:imidazolonepropionase-like amidohydrolase
MVSGGLTSPYDPIENSQFADEELTAIVEEARAWHTYVAAHAYTADAIRHALRCGVRSIEHANLIDAETTHAVALAGAYVVPTLATFDALARRGNEHGLSDADREKIMELRDKGMEALELCERAGVRIGMGTDLLGSLRDEQARGLMLHAEILGARSAFRSATLVNAELIGKEGVLGVVKPGAIADLLIVDGDPLTDPGVFDSEGKRLALIMKCGQIYKNELSR